MDLAEIRDALEADLIDALPTEINVYARRQQTMQAPYVLITTPTEGDNVVYYQSWKHGVEMVRWTLELRAGGRYEDAIRTIDALLSWGSAQPESVSQALRNPPNLTALGVGCVVRNTSGAEEDETGVGALIPVELYPPKET